MTTTTFQNGVTLTDEDWFNDVDFLVYDLFGDSTTTASAAARLAPSFVNLTVGGTLSVSAQSTMAGLTVGGAMSVSAQSVVQALRVGGVLSLSGVAGSVASGIAKGWVRFDGTATSVTSAAAFNVTAITDNGTGNYTIGWTTPFSSANYVVDVSSSLNNSRLVSISSTNAQVVLLDLSGTAADAAIVCMVAFGSQ